MNISKTFFILFIAITSLLACTEQKSQSWITELDVIPSVFNIQSEKFYTKPFTVRARYSDGKTENVTKEVQWVSENNAMVGVSREGELQKTGNCTQAVCVVSLVVTHPGSGQSQRVEVKLFPEKKEPVNNAKKTEPQQAKTQQAPVENTIEDSSELDSSVSDVSETIAESPGAENATIARTVLATDEKQVTDPASIQTANRTTQSSAIRFARSVLTLTSGQQTVLDVVTDPDGKLVTSDYQCEIESSDPDVLSFESACVIRALAPGKARIVLTSATQLVSSKNTLDLQVVPLEISTSQLSAQNIHMDENQQQLWFKITGLNAGEVQRYIARGNQPVGFQIFVMPFMENSQGTCINTVPPDAQQVACIVQPVYDHVFLMLYKPIATATQVNLSIESPASNYLNYNYLANAARPQELAAENPFSAFIVANDLGVFNRHYFYYQPTQKTSAKIRVLLTGFNAAPGLEVFWANGYCAANKVVTEQGKVYCDLPADAEGVINIIVIGNNQGGINNGPVAEIGGTPYEVLVTLK